MPDRTHLLIAGGGPAALEAALAIRRLAGERFRITLLSSRDEFVYRPVAVAEPFGFLTPERFSLPRMAAALGVDLRLAVLAEVDPESHHVVCADGETLSYDVLLLALGARPGESIPGALTFPWPAGQCAAARGTRVLALGGSVAGGVRRRPGDGLDAPVVRARSDGRALGRGARSGARGLGGDL